MKFNRMGAIFIIAGILILVLPNIIEYLIGISLIIIGILYLIGRRIL